jgi:hypothetical protein
MFECLTQHYKRKTKRIWDKEKFIYRMVLVIQLN